MRADIRLMAQRLLQLEAHREGGGVDLRDVLAVLSPDAHALQWTILDLPEVVDPERWDLNLPLVYERVDASPTGMHLAFEELEHFAARTGQVIDGLFVGCESAGRFPRRSDDDRTIVAKADMLVAAVDSTFWLVGAPEPVLARVSERLGPVTDNDLDRVGLSTWGREP